MTALPPMTSKPSVRSKEPFTNSASIAYPQGAQAYHPRYQFHHDQSGVRDASNPARRNHYDKTKGNSEYHEKESVKPFLSTRVPALGKGRTSVNKGHTASPQVQVASRPVERTSEGPNLDAPFSHDTRYGVEVLITGGNDAKPKKSTFAEKAAKLGREAFGSGTRQPWKGVSGRIESAKYTTQRRSPDRYTAVRNLSDMSLSGSYPSSNSSNNSQISICSFPFESKREDLRDAIPSSIYDDTERADAAVPPLNINKKPQEVQTNRIPLRTLARQLKQTPSVSSMPVRPRSRAPDGGEELARSSIDSNDSNETVTAADKPQATSHFSWTTYADTASECSRVMSHQDRQLNTTDPESRFSWTTASTDSTYQEERSSSSPPTASNWSIMSRRRPVAGRDVVLPKRYDSLRKAGKAQGRTQSLGLRCEKALPETPKAEQELSHVEELTRQLEGLEVRKSNMEKVMMELKKVDSASPLEVSEKMRRENRRKMSDVQMQQDEVQREMFEVGRLVVRARKRAEEFDGQSTGLWLRRVTD